MNKNLLLRAKREIIEEKLRERLIELQEDLITKLRIEKCGANL